MTSNMGAIDRLRRLDTRILYAIALLIIAWLYYAPAPIPIPVSEYTNVFYKTIQNLPPKSVVLLTSDFSARESPECYPGLVAITEQLLSKDLRLVVTTLNVQGYVFVDNALRERNAWARKKYGVDFVNLGWIPGEAAGVASFAKDIRSVFKRDYYGTPVDDLPIMKGVNSYQDIVMVIEVYADQPGVEIWMQQMVARYDMPLIYYDIQSHLSDQLKYYRAGLAKAILSGLRGCAEFEYLMGKPLAATRNMSTQTILGVLLLFCMIMANVNYFGTRAGRKK